MDESVICLDPAEVIDLSETVLVTPGNSREDDLFQGIFTRERKKKRKCLVKAKAPEEVIDLSNESDLDLPKNTCPSPKKSEGQSRKSMDMCCPICLERYSNVQLKATSCGHVFCTPCIEATIKATKTCPKCRKRLTLKNLITLYL